MKKITARDVAQKAGVSIATVSLVLNNKPGISVEVREKVLNIASELGYSFKRTRNKLIQLVVYKRHGKVLSNNPSIELIMSGIAEQAANMGYHLSTSYFYGDKNRQEQLRGICSLKCDGMILLATEMTSADIAVFDQAAVPFVLLDNFSPSMMRDSIMTDNIYGVRSAIKYLIQCGHTRIGYLHSKVDFRNIRERKTGYLAGCQMLPEQNIRDAERRIVQMDISIESAAQSMRDYLATDPILPTAFFADNDHIAAGCCRALQEVGYRIPDDVSIIGFDDSPICQAVVPPLTTMTVEKEQLGAIAVLRAVERIEHPEISVARLLIMPSLKVRESVLDLSGKSKI